MNVLIIAIMLFNLSCKSTEDKLQCLTAKTKAWQQLEVYKSIRSQFSDTLQKWIDTDVKAVSRFKVTSWMIDETVFFNSELKGAVLLVLRQDTSIAAKMDFIDMVYAKKEAGIWRFFYKSMPRLQAERYYRGKKDPAIPYTFEELSGFAKKKIIESGYFKEGTCEINDSYINDWYTETLEKKHREFLNNK